MLFSLIEETHQHAGSDVALLLCNFFSFLLHPSSSSFCVSKGSQPARPAVSPYPPSSFEKSESNEIIAGRTREKRETRERVKEREREAFLLLINVFRAVSSRARRVQRDAPTVRWKGSNWAPNRHQLILHSQLAAMNMRKWKIAWGQQFCVQSLLKTLLLLGL